MKKCPECGLDLPDEVLYCLYCGTNTNVSKLVKTNRKLFFIFPFLLLFVCLGITFDFGSSTFLETGLVFSGIVIGFYYLGPLLLGFFQLFFKIHVGPDSYFLSALSSVVNVIATVVFVYVIVCHHFEEYFERLGPSEIINNYLISSLSVYLVVQIIETIVISIKAKISSDNVSDNISKRQSLFKYAYIAFPALYLIIAIIGFSLNTVPNKIAFYSEFLMSISAYEKAEVLVNKGLESFPDNDKLCFLKASILSETDYYRGEDKRKEALRYIKIASDQKPNSPLYKVFLSFHYEVNKDYDEAIRYADEAANLAKNDVGLWLNLGNLNQKHLRLHEACEAYKKVLSIDSQNALALNNFSYALLTDNKKLPIALEMAKKSVEINPYSIENKDTLAWAYYKNNQFTNALETINLLYENRKDISPEVDFHYAAILDSVGLLNNSLETYDKMLVKPEVIVNINLVRQIIEARNKAEEKLKGKK